MGVNTTSRRIILWILNATAAFVGIWALVFPRGFSDAFPGFGFAAWVGHDGPYNEHLIRDVGALYLALLAAGVVAALQRRADAAIAVGAAWLVFSVPHLGYHVAHLEDLSVLDAVAQSVALAAPIVLSIPLLVPARAARTTTAGTTTELEHTR